jgi:hypothetical protein
MRTAAVALAILLCGTAWCGCTAVDDFGAFQFDGSARDGASDGGHPVDLAPAPTGHLGDACTPGSCVVGLTCVTGFPGGICTRPCDLSQSTSCAGLDADCTDVGIGNNMGLCLVRCTLVCSRAQESYTCCRDGNLTGGAPGVCAPAMSPVCKH